MANFERSLPRIRVPLKPTELCCLKRHFRGAVREVVGYLERKALQRPDRFVFASERTIASWCRRYRGKAYTYQYVRLVLVFLRDLGVISERHQRDDRWGVHILHHDQVTYGTETDCRWCGIDLPMAGETEEQQLARVHSGIYAPQIPRQKVSQKKVTSEKPNAENPLEKNGQQCSQQRGQQCSQQRGQQQTASNETFKVSAENTLQTKSQHDAASIRVEPLEPLEPLEPCLESSSSSEAVAKRQPSSASDIHISTDKENQNPLIEESVLPAWLFEIWRTGCQVQEYSYLDQTMVCDNALESGYRSELSICRADREKFPRFLQAHGELTAALAWVFYVYENPPKYNIMAPETQGISSYIGKKDGKEKVRVVRAADYGEVTRFPLAAFLSSPDAYILAAKDAEANFKAVPYTLKDGYKGVTYSIGTREIHEDFGRVLERILKSLRP